MRNGTHVLAMARDICRSQSYQDCRVGPKLGVTEATSRAKHERLVDLVRFWDKCENEVVIQPASEADC